VGGWVGGGGLAISSTSLLFFLYGSLDRNGREAAGRSAEGRFCGCLLPRFSGCLWSCSLKKGRVGSLGLAEDWFDGADGRLGLTRELEVCSPGTFSSAWRKAWGGGFACLAFLGSRFRMARW